MQAGFSGAYTKYEAFRSILTTYDPLVPDSLSKRDFGDPRLDKSMQLAVRFQSKYAGLIGGFQFYINDVINKQINPANNQNDNVLFRMRRLTYFVGGEFYVGRFTLGATLDFNDLNIKWQDLEDTKSLPVFNDKALGNRFYLAWELPYNDAHAFIIQPYIQLTNQTYDFRPVAEAILPAPLVNSNPAAYREKPVTYGVSFIFSNGGQRY